MTSYGVFASGEVHHVGLAILLPSLRVAALRPGLKAPFLRG
jgi:hypothetical protein